MQLNIPITHRYAYVYAKYRNPILNADKKMTLDLKLQELKIKSDMKNDF